MPAPTLSLPPAPGRTEQGALERQARAESLEVGVDAKGRRKGGAIVDVQRQASGSKSFELRIEGAVDEQLGAAGGQHQLAHVDALLGAVGEAPLGSDLAGQGVVFGAVVAGGSQPGQVDVEDLEVLTQNHLAQVRLTVGGAA